MIIFITESYWQLNNETIAYLGKKFQIYVYILYTGVYLDCLASLIETSLIPDMLTQKYLQLYIYIYFVHTFYGFF